MNWQTYSIIITFIMMIIIIIVLIVAVSGSFPEVTVWLAWSAMHQTNTDCINSVGTAQWQLPRQSVSLTSTRRHCRRCPAYNTAVLWSPCAATRWRGRQNAVVAGNTVFAACSFLLCIVKPRICTSHLFCEFRDLSEFAQITGHKYSISNTVLVVVQQAKTPKLRAPT